LSKLGLDKNVNVLCVHKISAFTDRTSYKPLGDSSPKRSPMAVIYDGSESLITMMRPFLKN